VPSAIEVGPGEPDGLMAPPVREYEFGPDDFVVETHEREGFKVEREGGIAVALSTVLSPELLSEGLARELVHHIQNTRKAADFQIDDRIHLRIAGPAEIAGMLAVHGDWVKKETLAVSLEVTTSGEETAGAGALDGTHWEALKVNGLPVTVEVWKA
jgi:isoleucyl-tRNA synthetase